MVVSMQIILALLGVLRAVSSQPCDECHISGASLLQRPTQASHEPSTRPDQEMIQKELLQRILRTPRSALILVDAMREYKETYGAEDYVLPTIRKLVQAFKTAGLPIYTKLWFESGERTALGRFYGWRRSSNWPFREGQNTELIRPMTQSFKEELLKTAPTKYVMRSLDCGESCFQRTYASGYFTSIYEKMARELAKENITTLFIVGGWTEHCIVATALDAKFRGFDVVLVPDGIAGSSKLFEPAMNMLQSYDIGTLDMPGASHAAARSQIGLEKPQDGGSEALTQTEIREDSWTALDAVFEAHWDLSSHWFEHGPWASVEILRNKKPRMALVLVEDTEAHHNILQEHFLEQGLPVYHVTPSSRVRLPSIPSSSVDTLVFAGNASGGALIHLCYSAFDSQFDTVLVKDAIHSARDVDDLLEVMRHSVALVASTAEIVSSTNPTWGWAMRLGKCIGSQGNVKNVFEGGNQAFEGDLDTCQSYCSKSQFCVAGEWQPDFTCRTFSDPPDFVTAANDTSGTCHYFVKARLKA